MERKPRMRAVPWFPVYTNQIEDQEFYDLTDAEKVFYFTLQSEMNEHSSFYRADSDYAAMLGLSLHKIREARRKFEDRFLINCTPGYQAKGRNMATHYHWVKWSSVQKEQGQFSQIHRFTFQCMLSFLRTGDLGHREVALYVHLAHMWWCRVRFGPCDHLEIGKRLLEGKSGNKKATQSLVHIRDALLRTKGSELFELQDRHTKITIKRLREFDDPSESEASHALVRSFEEDIRSRAARLRAGHTDFYDHRLDALFGESPS